MNHAAGYFAAKEINGRLRIESADDLWTWITGDDLSLAPPRWGLDPGQNLVFRGQANAEYGLSSKLYRDLKAGSVGAGSGELREKVLSAAERTVIALARDEGVGRNMTDGEVLAVLQHHGVATRLLDVSLSPLEALFFAVDDHANLDGRLFCFFLHPAADGDTPRRSLAQEQLPWYGVARGTKSASSEWTATVALIDDGSLDPRMRAQNGAFLVGGLNRRYSGDQWVYDDQDPTAREIQDISTLRVNFLKATTGRPNESYGATAWTVRVKADWKSELRQRLASIDPPITFDSMYPPITELKRLAAREIRTWEPG